MRSIRLFVAATAMPAAVHAVSPRQNVKMLLPALLRNSIELGSHFGYGDEKNCTGLPSPWARSALHLADDGSDCQVVVAHYGAKQVGGLRDIRAMLPTQCSMLVYDKSPSHEACKFMPMNGVHDCIMLPNLGYEQNTYVEHMLRNYDDLPKWLVLLPNPMDKHARRYELQRMLNVSVLRADAVDDSSGSGLEGHGFSCIDHTPGPDCDGGPLELRVPLSGYSDCRMTNYFGETVPANPPHVGAWLAAHLPSAAAVRCHLPTCHFGVAVTTRENVRVHSIEVWRDLRNMTRVKGNPQKPARPLKIVRTRSQCVSNCERKERRVEESEAGRARTPETGSQGT